MEWLALCRSKSVRPEGEKGDKDELKQTVIRGDHECLRDVRLCESMITDHYTEAYFRALGQENPAHAEKVGSDHHPVLSNQCRLLELQMCRPSVLRPGRLHYEIL